MGRPPIGQRAMTAAEKQRAYRARQRTQAPTPPVKPLENQLVRELARSDEGLILERMRADPQEAARWLRSKLDDDTARHLGRALAPPASWATLAGSRNLLNIDHVRRSPDQVIPWVVDKLAGNAPPAARTALEQALTDLAQVLKAVAVYQ